jgi:predicted metalloprotease with PDZ domain
MGPAFVALRDRCLERLKAVLKTRQGFPIAYAASGHGAWDASIANLFSPGDKVLVPQTGYFAENWAKTAGQYGLEVEMAVAPERHAVDPEMVARHLAADGKGAKLGVRLQPLTPEIARQLKLEGEGGVLIADVSPDGAAARAGIQRGDVILEVAQEAVSKPEQVVAAVSKAKPGDVVLLRVKRGNQATFIPVKIPEPEAPEKK